MANYELDIRDYPLLSGRMISEKALGGTEYGKEGSDSENVTTVNEKITSQVVSITSSK